MNKVLLALGNDLLGDDSVAFHAARAIAAKKLPGVTVIESAESGLALLDLLEGADFALLLDAIVTGKHPPGTILEFGPGDFKQPVAPSTHFAGLPEIIKLARQMEMKFPETLRVLAMEIAIPDEFGQKLSTEVERTLPAFTDRARKILRSA